MARSVEQQAPDAKQSFLSSRNRSPVSPITPDATEYPPPPQPVPYYGPPPSEKPLHHSPVVSWLPTRHTILRLWLGESLASAFSLIIFIVIIIVLSTYDDKEYGATSILTEEKEMKRPLIFSILSFASAVMRASMLLPVASAIGQLKWSWFSRPQSLIDMERFDEASRGITGSLVLLWTVRLRHLAAVGAALTILALPIDAFIQSSIMLPQMRELNEVSFPRDGYNITNTTSFPKTTQYWRYQTMQSEDKPWASSAMINGIKFGISYMTGLKDAFSAQTPIDCPTGYCEFGRFQTLEVDRTCVDRSDALVEETDDDDNYYLSLPGTDLKLYNQGATIGNESFYKNFITSRSYTNYSEKVFNMTIGSLITRTALIVDSSGDDWDKPVAFECAYYWGLSTVDGKVDQAISPFMNKTTVPLRWNYTDKPTNKDYAHVLWPATECWVNNTLVHEAANETFYNEQCVYGVSVNAHLGIQNFILDRTDGLSGDSTIISYNETTEATVWSRTNHFITNVYEITVDKDRDAFAKKIPSMFLNIAIGMTRIIQTDSGDDAKHTRGYVYRNVFRYHIEWVRLTQPAVMVVGSTVFFIVTAVLTAKDRGWRRSNLPLLFHGLGRVERELCGEVKELADMEHVASRMHVTLGDMGEGEKFVSQVPLTASPR